MSVAKTKFIGKSKTESINVQEEEQSKPGKWRAQSRKMVHTIREERCWLSRWEGSFWHSRWCEKGERKRGQEDRKRQRENVGMEQRGRKSGSICSFWRSPHSLNPMHEICGNSFFFFFGIYSWFNFFLQIHLEDKFSLMYWKYN